MKIESIKDGLTILALGGTLAMTAGRFIGNVQKVPEQEAAIQQLRKRVGRVERKTTFLVAGMEKLTRTKYTERDQTPDAEDQP